MNCFVQGGIVAVLHRGKLRLDSIEPLVHIGWQDVLLRHGFNGPRKCIEIYVYEMKEIVGADEAFDKGGFPCSAEAVQDKHLDILEIVLQRLHQLLRKISERLRLDEQVLEEDGFGEEATDVFVGVERRSLEYLANRRSQFS